MPSSLQKSYFALRAFNIEIASIKDSQSTRRYQQHMPLTKNMNGDSSSQLALQLRIQWWKNSIDEIYLKNNAEDRDNNRHQPQLSCQNQSGDEDKKIVHLLSTSCWNSPIVRSLDRCYIDLQHKLNIPTPWTKRFLERLIDSRENDLFVTQNTTLQEQTSYAEESVSSFLYLLLETCGVSN
jgi:NADH dehydrogenase [ubiquinone] 1 alpha subcomplex assembly factor 6